uniref:Uncharacterized protein n=1 Tax=Panagrolaimus sp. PS1159 TaxID=55785 RepID=A0AC35GEM6_9BILA
KRFDERNGQFGNDEDRRFAIVQRKIDPDYCIRQLAAVEKGDSNNGTKQQQRRQIPQLKRRRESVGAAVGGNLPKIVRPNYIRLQPRFGLTYRPVFDSNSPLRFSRSDYPVVNDGPRFRRHLTSSNERRSESVSMIQSNVVKTENIEQRTSEPIVITIDSSPSPSPSLNADQNGADFDDIASVHRPSPRPSIFDDIASVPRPSPRPSMASATVSRSSSLHNALMPQQQPTIGDETAQQQIPPQGNNQIPTGEEPTNPLPDRNVPEPAQLQQEQLHQGAPQEHQEVDNLPMMAAEVERLKKENEYKMQAFNERLKSKLIDKMAEELNSGI